MVYRYLQIRHYITKHTDLDHITNQYSIIVYIYLNALHQQNQRKFHIYKQLIKNKKKAKTRDNMLRLKGQWELEVIMIRPVCML